MAVFAFLCAAVWPALAGQPTAKAHDARQLTTFEACATTGEAIFGYIRDHQAGIPLAVEAKKDPASDDAARIYWIIEHDGLEEAYRTTNANYARCSLAVAAITLDKPHSPDPQEAKFGLCSLANLARFKAITRAEQKGDLSSFLTQLPDATRASAKAAYETAAAKGALQAFVASAGAHRTCMATLPPLAKR